MFLDLAEARKDFRQLWKIQN